MLDYTEYPEKATVEITVDGHISSEAFDDMAKKLKAFIESHDEVRLLEIVREIRGMDPTVLWKDMGFAFRHMNSFSRCAIVTDTAWIKWWSSMVSPFLRCEVQEFGLNEIDRARDWLQRTEKQAA